MQNRFAIFLLAFSILTLLLLPVTALLPTADDAGVYDAVIRLHVPAHSDSAADQAEKLAVRDAVLAEVSRLLDGITDRAAAEAVLAEHLPAVESAARDVLAERGSTHSVRATFGEAYYPTRVYGGVTLPAGTYKSLSVAIGGGEGANWWCVLFPQLCTGGEAEEAMVAAGLTPSQIRLITGDSPDVVIRFRLLEWLQAIFSGR